MPEVDVQDGIVGLGPFVEEDLVAGSLSAEYTGTPMSHYAAENSKERQTGVSITDEYQLLVKRRNVLIDAMWDDCEGTFANKSCSPNARYVPISLNGVNYAVMLIETLQIIPNGIDIFVGDGWYRTDEVEVFCSACN